MSSIYNIHRYQLDNMHCAVICVVDGSIGSVAQASNFD